MRDGAFPSAEIRHALAGSLLPWIYTDLGNGQSKEEWKAQAEGNKILGRTGTTSSRSTDCACGRRDALPQPGADDQAAARRAARRHRRHLGSANPWVRVVPTTRKRRCRADAGQVTGTLSVPIGGCASCTWARILVGFHRRRSAVVGAASLCGEC
jgi:aspartate-semialdehyde dehydrogenase